MLLAPVIRMRKGEHTDKIAGISAMGMARVRIDGTVYETDDAPVLEKNKKHTVEAVVDRLKIREDIRQRLAESLESCLSLSEGLAVVAFMGKVVVVSLLTHALFLKIAPGWEPVPILLV